MSSCSFERYTRNHSHNTKFQTNHGLLSTGDGEVKIKSERSDYSDDESKPLKSRSKKPVKPRIKKLDKSTSVNRPPNKTETSESQTFSDTQSENQEIFIKGKTHKIRFMGLNLLI